MKKFSALLIGLLFVGLFFALPAKAFAKSCIDEYGKNFDFIGGSFDKDFSTGYYGNSRKITLGTIPDGNYTLKLQIWGGLYNSIGTSTASNNKVSFTLPKDALNLTSGEFSVGENRRLSLQDNSGKYADCDLWAYHIGPAAASCKITVSATENGKKTCCYEPGTSYAVTVSDTQKDGKSYTGPLYLEIEYGENQLLPNPPYSKIFSAADLSVGDHKFKAWANKIGLGGTFLCEKEFSVNATCSEEDKKQCEGESTVANEFLLCKSTTSAKDYDTCQKCVNDKGIWTAIGCLKTAPSELIPQLLRIAVSIAGGLTLLMLLFGAFRLSTSAGDPKAVEEAQETMTNAVIGLAVILLSVVLLRVIGVDILGIPGL